MIAQSKYDRELTYNELLRGSLKLHAVKHSKRHGVIVSIVWLSTLGDLWKQELTELLCIRQVQREW
jgi:hypothetical protein